MKRTALFLGLCFLGWIPAWGGTPSRADYERSLQAFQKHLESKRAEVKEKSGGFRDPGLPFVLTHGRPTLFCVLLLHGLSDSPYFMRDLADSLYHQGYNVVVPLLSGNGTHYTDLAKVTLEDWKKDVDLAVEVASGLGNEVLVGGLSAGSALSLDAARRYPQKVKGLLLFSPALSFQKRTSRFSCWYKRGFVAGKLKDVPIRYQQISNNGVCQLYRLVRELDLSAGKAGYPIPIFAVLTEIDDVIKVQWTVDWIEGQGNPGNMVLAYVLPEGKSLLHFKSQTKVLVPEAHIRHAQVTRKNNEYNDEWNPRFEVMEKALREFLKKNFPSAMPGKRMGKP